jgi:amino acid transporter
MEYYDWFIIFSAMIIIVFITLLGISVLEKDLKKEKWLLWFSLAGLIISIIITGVIIWYYHKKFPDDHNGPSDTMKEKGKSNKEVPDARLVDVLNKEEGSINK